MANVFRSVLATAKAILQSKTTTVTPTANWSSAYTEYSSITPDTGYTGMSDVQVRTPMIRDNTLVTASSVTTPSTVYNGDTSQSNSDKCLRLAPTKDGMAYTGSYLYLKPNSYLGNASASDVLSGKTFSSSNGIQITGTGSGGVTPSGNKALSYTTNGTETGIDVTNYATVSVTRNIPSPTITSLTPSNTSPPALSTSYNYNPTKSGYAIESYANASGITPTAAGTYFSSGWNRMTSSGYACTGQQVTAKTGTFSASTSSQTTIDVGFHPKFLALVRPSGTSVGSGALMMIYNESYSSNIQFYASGSVEPSAVAFGSTTNRLNSITSTGFIMNKVGSSYVSTWYYFAVG